MSLQKHLFSLANEARELYLDQEVPVLANVPSPIVFYRDWVASNKPVVFKNGFNHWQGLNRWNNSYLREHIGDLEVTVTVTPNGYADAVYENKFVMPEEKVMQFGKFLDIVEGKSGDPGVYYIQKQNSNFTDEFKAIISDAETDIPWATEAFGKTPDAVNFWMGEEKAVTSLHKDHYENIYCVVRGEKTFTLIPPTDQPFIPYEIFPAARYKVNNGSDFEVIDDPDTGKVPWIPVDPDNPDFEKYPMYKNARPLKITLKAGECLYLPSLWYHHVRQSQGCIAVNFWYDMEYDIKYNYYKFVEDMCGNKF